MDSKLDNTTQKPSSYDQFEPFCNWRHEDDRDTLVLHLPEFKKEQLKVQISNLRALKISGERPLSASKSSRFYKEVKVDKECNLNEIHAKFINGLLYVVMPKKVTTTQEKEVAAPSAHEKVQLADKQPNGGTSPESDGASKKNASDEEKTLHTKQETTTHVPRSSSNMAIKLALAIMAAATGIYMFYRYKTMHVGEFDNAFNLF